MPSEVQILPGPHTQLHEFPTTRPPRAGGSSLFPRPSARPRRLRFGRMAARLDALILCDFAQVRDGLLFVQSGGLTRLRAGRLPATFRCHVATLVYLPPDEAAAAHHVVM